MRAILAPILALVLGACGREAPPAPKATAPAIHSVRFGASANQLLLTVCGPDGAVAEEPCAVLVDDLATDTATRIEAPPGHSLAYPTPAPDGRIVATTVAVATDAKGNARSSLVSFPATGAPVARTLVSASRTLLHPDVLDGTVYAFLQKCFAKTGRYCEHEVVRVEDGRLRLATPRGVGLREVTRVISGGGEPIVWGNLPEAVLEDQEGFVEYAGSTNVWRLVPSVRFGLDRLSADVEVYAAGPERDGSIVAFTTGKRNLGLDRIAGGRVVPLASYPKTFPSIGRGLLDMDVAGNGSAVLLWSMAQNDVATPIVLYDATRRNWRVIVMPRIVRRVMLVAG